MLILRGFQGFFKNMKVKNKEKSEDKLFIKKEETRNDRAVF